MADTKISNLTALAAAPSSGDFFAIVDTSASETKKINAIYLVSDSGGTGAIVTGAYTLTLPASGTAALLATSNVFTNDQSIGNGTGGYDLIINGAAGETRNLTFQTAGVSRWFLTHTADAESGSNAGSNLRILARSDAGAAIATSISITRSTGRVAVGTTSDLGQLTIDQSSTTAAIPTLSLDQADISEGFIDYIGTSAASAAGPISSWTVATIAGYVRCEINGVAYWMPYYNAPTA